MGLWDNIEEAAGKLGLSARGREAEGVVDGVPISVELSLTDQQTHIFVRGHLQPPLDLGLGMHRRQVVLTGLSAVETHDEDLDAEFAVSGDDPARTRVLFTASVCKHLVALNRAPFDFSLHDGGCAFFQPYGVGANASWIVQATHAAARTVTLLDQTRSILPPAAPLAAHAEALRPLAAARGLAFATAPLSVSGLLEGRPLSLAAVRAGRRRHHLAARAPFETELGLGLALRRERLVDGIVTFLGGQDVTIGDEAFDRRFLVRVRPEHAARIPTLLDAEARAALLSLDERAGNVSIDDAGVTVAPIDPHVPPETVAWALDALDEARARVERNLLHGGEGGPYR
jgi:hypothetical protein